MQVTCEFFSLKGGLLVKFPCAGHCNKIRSRKHPNGPPDHPAPQSPRTARRPRDNAPGHPRGDAVPHPHGTRWGPGGASARRQGPGAREKQWRRRVTSDVQAGGDRGLPLGVLHPARVGAGVVLRGLADLQGAVPVRVVPAALQGLCLVCLLPAGEQRSAWAWGTRRCRSSPPRGRGLASWCHSSSPPPHRELRDLGQGLRGHKCVPRLPHPPEPSILLTVISAVLHLSSEL